MSNAESAIEVEGVWKIFGKREHEAFEAVQREGLGKAQVLERFDCVIGISNASFNVGRGEIFCIMGLSGSGKSTMVRHINRLLAPTAGQVRVGGKDVMAMNDLHLRALRNRHIAMVFQDFGLMPHRSVRDNVAMALEIRGEPQNVRWAAAERALAMVELSAWRDKFAHELSGGMQQRVGLARAIAADADVLLMDEPFSALDPLIRRQLQAEFMKLAAIMKKTTVFITHDLDEAVRIGHRIAIMRDGAIVQIGTPEQIVMHPADAYVSDFVSGISRLNLIRAHSLMRPVGEYEQKHGPVPSGSQTMGQDVTLNRLIEAAVRQEGPLLIQDGSSTIVGVISRKELLEGVVAGSEAAT
jgi:glycine betaine/proline transport system ATP-binding protein